MLLKMLGHILCTQRTSTSCSTSLSNPHTYSFNSYKILVSQLCCYSTAEGTGVLKVRGEKYPKLILFFYSHQKEFIFAACVCGNENVQTLPPT